MNTGSGYFFPMKTVVNQPTSSLQYPGMPPAPGFTVPNVSNNLINPVVNQPVAFYQHDLQAVQFSNAGVSFPSSNSVSNFPVLKQPAASINNQFAGIQFPLAAPVKVWMPISFEQLNEGFEYLAPLDGLVIHQLFNVVEAETGYETGNRYAVKNIDGQIIYLACEGNPHYFGSSRAFEIKIMDCRGVEVIHLSRNCNCSCCCCPCCLQEMDVVSKKLNGRVEQKWSCCEPKLHIKTNGETTDLKIDGKTCVCSADKVFDISDIDGSVIGSIKKKWMGFFMETHTHVDNFELSFPQDISVDQKIMLIGTTLLLDFMYFEDK